MKVFEIQNLEFSYNSNDNAVLSKLSLNVEKHSILSIVGPSGSGKTTLLQLLAERLRPISGEILKNGIIVEDIYLAPQQTSNCLLDFRTTLENSLLAKELNGEIDFDNVKDARNLLASFELNSSEHKMPHELSFGMKQRLLLTQTLLASSRVMLLDEPFSGLDVITRRLCERIFLEHCDEHSKTALVVTHDIETAVAISNTVLVMSGAPWHRTKILSLPPPISNGSVKNQSFSTDSSFSAEVLNIQKVLTEITL